MRPPAALYVPTSPGMNARARRSALPFAMVTLLVAGTAGLVACSDEAAADADGEPPPGDTRADGATGGGDPRNDGGTTSSDGGGAAVDSGGGQSDAGGEGGVVVEDEGNVGSATKREETAGDPLNGGEVVALCAELDEIGTAGQEGGGDGFCVFLRNVAEVEDAVEAGGVER